MTIALKDVDPELARRVRVAAAYQDVTMKEFMLEAVRKALNQFTSQPSKPAPDGRKRGQR